MKKKLLITLGCSFTEGVGCYEPSLLDNNGKPIRDEQYVYSASLNRFHTLGWPARLQQKLQYDCLWNLGRGAASNSENVKRWFELFSDVNFSNQYDVLVLWMITFSGRISFYRNGRINSLLPNLTQGSIEAQALIDSYVGFIGNDFDKDLSLEMYFYANVLKNICLLSNYKFLYINVDNVAGKSLDSLLNSPFSLNSTYKKLYPEYNSVTDRNSNEYTAYCGHPNEKGYELIADRLYNMIAHEHSYLINDVVPSNYEMKYLGEPKQW